MSNKSTTSTTSNNTQKLVNTAPATPSLARNEGVGSLSDLASRPAPTPAQAAQPALPPQGSLFTRPKRPNGTFYPFSSQGGRSRRTRRTRRTRRSRHSRR
jgi:hypothetical protein